MWKDPGWRRFPHGGTWWWSPDLREGTPSWQEGRQGSGCARWHTEALQEMYTWKPRVGQRQWLMVLVALEKVLQAPKNPPNPASSVGSPLPLWGRGVEQYGAVHPERCWGGFGGVGTGNCQHWGGSGGPWKSMML